MDKIKILGVPIDRVTMREAVARTVEALSNDKKFFIVTPNSEIVFHANKDKKLHTIIEKADMVVPDGIGLVIGSKIVGKPLKERVTGIDLMENLLKYADEAGKSIYLIGGKEGVAQEAGFNIKEKYKNLKIAGTHHGYFKGSHTGHPNSKEETLAIEHLNAANPDIVFVALGAPRQEFFIDANIEKMKGKVFMGVGGSLDVYSGKVNRAPKIYQNLGLEWLYRLIQEPWRFKRMSALPLFLIYVLLKRDKSIHRSD